MKPKDVQVAVKKLRQFLLDEYGWDTQAPSNPPTESDPPEGSTHQSGSSYTAYRLGSVSGRIDINT